MKRTSSTLSPRDCAAKARRKVNNTWQFVESSRKYRTAVRIESYKTTTRKIQEEVMDGILLNLHERNSEKSYSVQMRLLRRIVEKRQAQTNHRKSGRSSDRLSTRANTFNARQCMTDLRNLRMGKGKCMRKWAS
jgi:hypothetical protein